MEEKKEDRKAPKSIRFPDDIEKKIEKKAEKERRSFSWVVIEIVTQYFKGKK
jgi:predicted transcriptional regulator